MHNMLNILSMITLMLTAKAQKTRIGLGKLRKLYMQPEITYSQIALYGNILRWKIEHERDDAQKGKKLVNKMMVRDEGYYKDMQWKSTYPTSNKLHQLTLEHPEMFKRLENG